MASSTRRALADFDNQHDFERMAADVLNGLGYSGVEPMAAAGGPDGGRDIAFREGDTPGIALVTLEKDIKSKFKRDLTKQKDGEGLIALFCNVDVSPTLKLAFTRDSINRGYRIEIFDLERLRSLLDTGLKDIRRRYLGIDDEVAARLRSDVLKLLRFPNANPFASAAPTVIESLLADMVPRRIFELLMSYEESAIREVPGVGNQLHTFLHKYYLFRQDALRIEADLLTAIGAVVAVRFSDGWKIYRRYALLRFAGHPKEDIIAGGDFLNYDITWDDAERTFDLLAGNTNISRRIANVYSLHQDLRQDITRLHPRA